MHIVVSASWKLVCKLGDSEQSLNTLGLCFFICVMERVNTPFSKVV